MIRCVLSETNWLDSASPPPLRQCSTSRLVSQERPTSRWGCMQRANLCWLALVITYTASNLIDCSRLVTWLASCCLPEWACTIAPSNLSLTLRLHTWCSSKQTRDSVFVLAHSGDDYVKDFFGKSPIDGIIWVGRCVCVWAVSSVPAPSIAPNVDSSTPTKGDSSNIGIPFS